MFTPKCTHKGCGWVGTPKDSETKAKQSVAMHVGRLHSKNIPTYKGKQRRRALLEASSHHGNGHAHVAIALPETTRGRNQSALIAPLKKRPYTRRQFAAPAASEGTEVKINHCYNCGASMQGAAEGIVIADLMKRNARFRAKVEKLLAAS